MPKILVNKATPTTLQSGKTKYVCIGSIDGEPESFDMWINPMVGQEFEGTVRPDPSGRFNPTVNPGAAPAGGGFKPGFKSDPETQKAIIRQNSLTNAVNYCIAKAQLMVQTDPDTAKEAFEELSGKHVIAVATYFAKYSEGLSTVVQPAADPSINELNIALEDIPF